MSDLDPDVVVERFHATNGRVGGYLGLGCAALVLVLALAAGDTGRPLGVAIAACLGGLLVWAALLRPALWVTRRHLVMRGMFHTDHVPLGAIRQVAVAQVLAVSAHGKRYVSPVIGHSARAALRTRWGVEPRRKPAAPAYPAFVEERIRQLVDEHAGQPGVQPDDVRRTYAWPEIAGVAVGVVALLVWWLV